MSTPDTTTPAAFVPRARLTVCIDFKAPQAWLAVAPTRALEDALGIEAEWLPVTVRVTPAERAAGAGDDRGSRHRYMRAQYYERDLQRYAAARGLVLGRASRTDDSRVAGIGLLAVSGLGRDAMRCYIDAVYSAYFTAGQPIALADVGTIARIVGAAGGDAASFAQFVAGDGGARFDALQPALAAAGVVSAPAYLVDDDLFNGRAHLPMIRWLLGDRAGPPPV